MASVGAMPPKGDPIAAWGQVGHGPGDLCPASQPELHPSLSLLSSSAVAQRGSCLFPIRGNISTYFIVLLYLLRL